MLQAQRHMLTTLDTIVPRNDGRLVWTVAWVQVLTAAHAQGDLHSSHSCESCTDLLHATSRLSEAWYRLLRHVVAAL